VRHCSPRSRRAPASSWPAPTLRFRGELGKEGEAAAGRFVRQEGKGGRPGTAAWRRDPAAARVQGSRGLRERSAPTSKRSHTRSTKFGPIGTFLFLFFFFLFEQIWNIHKIRIRRKIKYENLIFLKKSESKQSRIWTRFEFVQNSRLDKF
jgi:hypothetical protein